MYILLYLNISEARKGRRILIVKFEGIMKDVDTR
jgi:hypothetical protein